MNDEDFRRVPSPRDRRRHKTQKDISHRDELMLLSSVSNHRYNPNSQARGNDVDSPTTAICTEDSLLMVATGGDSYNIIPEEAEYDGGGSMTDKEALEEDSFTSDETEEDISKYGYGGFTPGEEEREAYITNSEYQENQPHEVDYNIKYGYGEASPNMIIDDEEMEDTAKYDYGDKSTVLALHSSQSHLPTQPLRSSMKRSNADENNKNVRRASIGCSLSSRMLEEIEVLLPGRREPVRRRRSITFDNDVNVQRIEPVKDLAMDGRKSLWFQEKEYEKIKIKTLALLDRVEHSSSAADGKRYCTRGLEKLMTPEATEVKKYQAWDSVFNEQFLQRKDGEYDEESLANIYKYSTKRSQSEASKRASLDAEAAQAYLKTTFRRQSSLEDDWKLRTKFNRRVSM